MNNRKEPDSSSPRPAPLSGNNARSLEAFARHLAAVISAPVQETVWAMTCNLMRDIGFAHAMYGYSPDSRGSKLGAQEDYLILSTLPHDVAAEMVNDGHYLQTVTFHWALENVGVASWSLTASDLGYQHDWVIRPDSKEFFARNGLRAGCMVGFPNKRTRGRAVMALFAPPTVEQATVDAWLEEWRDVIFVAATAAHRSLAALPYPSSRGHLTARQREVLEWVAEGKTAADIAAIMGITPPTVDKHLRLARETLGVETTAHALVKAAFLNQMFVTHTRGAERESPEKSHNAGRDRGRDPTR